MTFRWGIAGTGRSRAIAPGLRMLPDAMVTRVASAGVRTPSVSRPTSACRASPRRSTSSPRPGRGRGLHRHSAGDAPRACRRLHGGGQAGPGGEALRDILGRRRGDGRIRPDARGLLHGGHVDAVPAADDRSARAPRGRRDRRDPRLLRQLLLSGRADPERSCSIPTRAAARSRIARHRFRSPAICWGFPSPSGASRPSAGPASTRTAR